MAQRNRYVKVALFEAVPTNLMGATIVGQWGDNLLVERPAPKPRAKSATRKPRTNANPATTVGGSATSFPSAGVTSGA